MGFRLDLIDRRNKPLGTVLAPSDLTLTEGISTVSSCSFSIEASDPMAPLLRPIAAALAPSSVVYLVVWEDGFTDPRFCGPIIGRTKTLTADTTGHIQITAAGCEWRLGRLTMGVRSAISEYIAIASSGAGGYRLDPGQPPTNLVDPSTLAARLIDAVSGVGSTSDTGLMLQVSTLDPAALSQTDYGIAKGTCVATGIGVAMQRFQLASKSVLAAITELGAPLGSFEWRFRPVAPTMPGGNRQVLLTRFDCTPAFGATNPLRWEYGFGLRNVQEITESEDATNAVNYALAVPPGWPDTENTGVAPTPLQLTEQHDAASVVDVGMMMDVVSTDLQTDDLRAKIAAEHVQVRKAARRIFTLTPAAQADDSTDTQFVPRYRQNFALGDVMPLVVRERQPTADQAGTIIGAGDVETVNITVRVYAVQTTVNADTGEVVDTLTVTPS